MYTVKGWPSSIWPRNGSLIGPNIPGHIRYESNSNEEILHFPWRSGSQASPSLLALMDLGEIAMNVHYIAKGFRNETSTSNGVISRTLRVGVFPLFRDAVGVIYTPSRLVCLIIQLHPQVPNVAPQPTGLSNHTSTPPSPKCSPPADWSV